MHTAQRNAAWSAKLLPHGPIRALKRAEIIDQGTAGVRHLVLVGPTIAAPIEAAMLEMAYDEITPGLRHLMADAWRDCRQPRGGTSIR
jgi:hypothetical protein